MLSRSVVTLFCDDIREEKNGMDTLIGVYPNNVNVPQFPFSFPKLGMYTRIHFDVEDSPGDITIQASSPIEENTPLTVMTEESFSEAQQQTKEEGLPIVGLISKALAIGFTVKEPGQVKIIVTIQGVEYLGGVLNVNQTPAD